MDDASAHHSNLAPLRVPVELVALYAISGDEGSIIYTRRRSGHPPLALADLFVRNGRFVAIVHYERLPPAELPLRVFPNESGLAA